ncbi:MAG TPA: hypothetical protein VHO48_15600 [Anaerolineaceae bacterium]|nr:hypothetical protein [Anaerolineaceae bacterium]
MIETKKFSLVKPTINTPFHIDFDWWQQHDNNWRVYLHDMLCEEHRSSFDDLSESTKIDWVDPETAEVRSVDGLQHVLISHCARQPEFLTSFTTLVDAAFRALLTNRNAPMTPVELSAIIGKPAETILRTLAGPTVYKGMRPVQQ